MYDNEIEPGGEISHKVCDVCGQKFELADVEQVFYHDGQPHEPLETVP